MTNKETATMLKSIRGLFSVSYSPESIVALSKAIELIEQMPDEHGDLIDRDALMIELMDRGIEGVQTDDLAEFQQIVMDAKAVIAAESEADADYQLSVLMQEYFERYEPTYNSEDGSM